MRKVLDRSRAATRPRQRTVRFQVSLTEGEAQQLERLSGQLGKPRAVALRLAAFDAMNHLWNTGKAEQQRLGDDDARIFRELITEINRVGVNINQIARKINDEGVQSKTTEEIADMIAEVGALVADANMNMARVVGQLTGGRS